VLVHNCKNYCVQICFYSGLSKNEKFLTTQIAKLTSQEHGISVGFYRTP